MKVTYNWLKDFVDVRISPKALADKLTMAGLEVTALEERSGDFIFEIEITSNRPDWLSVAGVAREVAAITGRRMKRVIRPSGHQAIRKGSRNPLVINVENKKDCPLYTAKIIKDVSVGPAPEWIRQRLELIGCRSINNIVDITNYVLFTYGQPLHAFDLDKLNLEKAIIVRRGVNGEKIIIIDGKEIIVNSQMLVIADQKKAVALAGIMGGKDTEVTTQTKNILLEAAIFDPVIIRRARQKLSIQTDSSYRFERGVTSEMVDLASAEAVRLIEGMAGGKCVLANQSSPVGKKKTIIQLDTLAIPKVLGGAVTVPGLKKIFSNLGLGLKRGLNKNLLVEIPFWRQDLNSAIDLVEEVARIYGYENIPKTVPAMYPQNLAFGTKDLISTVKNILVGTGLNEVITYSLVDRTMLKGLEVKYSDKLLVVNPLNKEQEILRPTLIPSLLKCVAFNLNQKQEEVSIFEIANTFSEWPSQAAPKEEPTLGIALSGTRTILLQQGLVKERLSAQHLKGIIEALFKRLGIKEYNFKPLDNPFEIEISAAGRKVGVILILDSRVLDNFQIKNKNVFAAEIYLNQILLGMDLNKKFVHLPLYPGIYRDISLVIREGVPAAEIISEVKEKAGLFLREAKISDYYQGKQIGEGFRGLTVSCIYRSDERTLTEIEINPVHAAVCAALTEKFAAKIR